MATTTTDHTTDPSRFSAELRNEVIYATAKHGEALREGGYISGLGDEVLVTDPAEFTHQDLATFYGLAASLIEGELATGVPLSPAEKQFVDRMVGYAGLK
jgi:hypothetical protein